MPKLSNKLNGRAISSTVHGRNKDDRFQGSQGSRVVGLFRDIRGPIGQTARFLSDYIVLPEKSILAVSSWIVAAWLADLWDRFPHLAITSPEKRCGKTRFLQLLELVIPQAFFTSNISPAALYRLIEQKRPCLLLDEAQSVRRGGSESSQVIRELFNASIDSNAIVIRCCGKRMTELQEFHIYSPKVLAFIGHLDGVLSDRCLPVEMERKTSAELILPYRSRVVEPLGEKLNSEFSKWSEKNCKQVAEAYDNLEPYPIENDRLAELLLPLQAVLSVAGGEASLSMLQDYAVELDEEDVERMSIGTQLLAACQEIYGSNTSFMPTSTLINALEDRVEEPWNRWSKGENITPEAPAKMLRPYGIRSNKTQKKVGGKVITTRGYFSKDFKMVWERYLQHVPQ